MDPSWLDIRGKEIEKEKQLDIRYKKYLERVNKYNDLVKENKILSYRSNNKYFNDLFYIYQYLRFNGENNNILLRLEAFVIKEGILCKSEEDSLKHYSLDIPNNIHILYNDYISVKSKNPLNEFEASDENKKIVSNYINYIKEKSPNMYFYPYMEKKYVLDERSFKILKTDEERDLLDKELDLLNNLELVNTKLTSDTNQLPQPQTSITQSNTFITQQPIIVNPQPTLLSRNSTISTPTPVQATSRSYTMAPTSSKSTAPTSIPKSTPALVSRLLNKTNKSTSIPKSTPALPPTLLNKTNKLTSIPKSTPALPPTLSKKK